MRVNSKEPYSLVYSLVKHPYFGYLIEMHAVQLTGMGNYSLLTQKIHSQTADMFNVPEDDLPILKILDEFEAEFIVKKFHKGKDRIRPRDFFLKHYSEELHESAIRPYIEKRLVKVLEKLRDKPLFLASKDNNHTHLRLHIAENKASILFHFRRNEEGTNYFATIKLNEQRIDFSQNGSELVIQEPAWLLVGNQLITFTKETDGNKLKPFLNKKFIKIPKTAEAAYFEKFVKPLVEQYDVYAVGFDIVSETHQSKPVLKLGNFWDNQICATLYFNYGSYQFPYHSVKLVSVSLEKKDDHYTFKRIRRSRKWEDGKRQFLEDMGLKLYEGSLFTMGDPEKPFGAAIIEVLNRHKEALEREGFIIEQDMLNVRYLLGQASVSFDVKTYNDWFDLKATVRFGNYEMPFIRLKQHILTGNREFPLPDGSIAVIPEEWFTKYSSLFDFGEETDDSLKIKKHHYALIEELPPQSSYLEGIEKLKCLSNPGQLETYDLPHGLKATLRPYQAEGFYWLQTLKDLGLGGCLADDMGLGKTLQALTMLQFEKEHRNTKIRESVLEAAPETSQQAESGSQIALFSTPTAVKTSQATNKPINASLIIVPTSLVFNWENEARKFTSLKTFVYSGFHRNKDSFAKQCEKYDIIISTYGTVRNDIDFISRIRFNTIILDEAQAIKNPMSQTAYAVTQLQASGKFVLTGTPVENSITDLWSQMNFLNPGLLGNYQAFTRKYVQAVEKDKDEIKTAELKRIIKPFILRRTKQEVARELPAKNEQILYCSMTEEQQQLYENTKTFFRNEILKSISTIGFNKSQMMILKGLMKLRQIANHPAMAEPGYLGDSGKFSELVRMADEAIANGHKVLIFSQFVQQLTIFRQYFDDRHVAYNYLDGSTLAEERRRQVEQFQNNDNIKLFLISLKAGGTGLNLTSADYVFIVDPWWNPAAERQAMDRTHRIGQNKTVFVYKFITRNTVEEKILQLQFRKKELSDELVENGELLGDKINVKDIETLLE